MSKTECKHFGLIPKGDEVLVNVVNLKNKR